MNQKEYTAFILSQRSYTSYIETIRFFTRWLKKDFETISAQRIGKQRMFINPKVFIDLYECFIDELYDKFSGFSKFKGHIVSACDGSIVDLPNVTLTHEEFPVGDENLLKEKKFVQEFHAYWMCILNIFKL